jgi:hypothetical protein
MRYIKLAQKTTGAKAFSFLAFMYCYWASVKTNFYNGNGAWQTDIFLSLESCYLFIKSPKKWKSAKILFSFYSYSMWQVKKIEKFFSQVSKWRRFLKWLKNWFSTITCVLFFDLIMNMLAYFIEEKFFFFRFKLASDPQDGGRNSKRSTTLDFPSLFTCHIGSIRFRTFYG